jgi:hypothetical protein
MPIPTPSEERQTKTSFWPKRHTYSHAIISTNEMLPCISMVEAVRFFDRCSFAGDIGFHVGFHVDIVGDHCNDLHLEDFGVGLDVAQFVVVEGHCSVGIAVGPVIVVVDFEEPRLVVEWFQEYHRHIVSSR